METKVCSKCSEEKPISSFSKNSTHGDGLQAHCDAIYDCHHVNPDTKSYNVANMTWKDWETEVIPELEKCIYVCSNCRRKLTKGWFDEELESGCLVLLPRKRR